MSIPFQKTPARPVEVLFAPETSVPQGTQNLMLIGHAVAGLPASSTYVVQQINNAGDVIAASGECVQKGFGASSELTKMVLAAIRANQVTGQFVPIKVCPLASTDVDFGALDIALTNVSRVQAEFVVSPYDGEDDTLRNKLKSTMATMSAPNRTDNSQFGSMGVVANMDETDPSALPEFDSQFVQGIWLKDTGTNAYSLGELAAAAAAVEAGNGAPFNPLDDVTINLVPAPAKQADWITVGAALESESALNQGWTPLKVKPNGEVAFVRTVSGRISADGSGAPVVTSYYDVQDLQVLYFWRKTIWTRESQPDFKQRKASGDTAKLLKSELVRLAKEFEAQSMFQAVDQLAKQFTVVRSASDRHRFDVVTPVNVIPGLHVIANTVVGTTAFDTLSI